MKTSHFAHSSPTESTPPARLAPLRLLTSFTLFVLFALFLGLSIVLSSFNSAWGQFGDELGMEDEMGMRNEYGESMDASGSSKAALSITETAPSPVVLWQMSQPNFSALREELARLAQPSTAPAAPIKTGPVLRNEAHVAFRYGNLPVARELFFGHLALGGEAAKRDLDTVLFSAQFRRPAWHIRWGLAIGLAGDTEVTDFDPIAANMSTSMGGGMGMDGMGMDDMGMDDMGMDGMGMDGMGMDGMGMESNMPNGSGRDNMMGMDGMMGDEMGMDGMGMDGMGMDEMGMDGGSGMRHRKEPEFQAPEPRPLDPAVAERLRELSGMVGDRLTEGLRSRIQEGRFGRALTDVNDSDPTQGYTVGGEIISPSDTPMWIPGVAFVGEGGTREMTETAAKDGIELLLYVVVSVKQSRTGDVQNICRAKIIDCKTGKTLIASGGMDNREVKRLLATKRGTPEAHIDEQLETFWKIVDSRLVLSPLPTLSPEVSRKRITQLMSDPSYSKLRKLAEVRLLHHKGWVTDEELERAFEIIAGADGVKILYAPLSESIPLVHELVRYSLIREVE